MLNQIHSGMQKTVSKISKELKSICEGKVITIFDKVGTANAIRKSITYHIFNPLKVTWFHNTSYNPLLHESVGGYRQFGHIRWDVFDKKGLFSKKVIIGTITLRTSGEGTNKFEYIIASVYPGREKYSNTSKNLFQTEFIPALEAVLKENRFKGYFMAFFGSTKIVQKNF